MLELINSSGSYPIPDVGNDYYITRKCSGVDTLHFEVPVYAEVFPRLAEEAYIYESSEQQVYVIKGISASGDTADVDCELNLEAWRDHVYVGYYNNTSSLPTTMEGITPDGWTVSYEYQDTQRRSVNLEAGGTALDVVLAAQDSYGCAMRFDTHTKTCTVYYPSRHQVSGTMLTETAGIRRHPDRTGKSTDLVTRIYPIGADGLTIEAVNDGKPYVENHTYTDKIIWQVWQDERYEVAESLRDDAQAMVDSLAVPAISFEIDLCDLYSADPITWAEHQIQMYQRIQLAYGDTVITSLVTEMEVHPNRPENNMISLNSVPANTISTVRALQNAINNRNSRYNAVISASIRDNVRNTAPTLGVTGATVGQIPVVAAVDSNGTPTAWTMMDAD